MGYGIKLCQFLRIFLLTFTCVYFQLECKKDAFSPELQQYCQSQPVVVIRGMAAALKLGKLANNLKNWDINS